MVDRRRPWGPPGLPGAQRLRRAGTGAHPGGDRGRRRARCGRRRRCDRAVPGRPIGPGGRKRRPRIDRTRIELTTGTGLLAVPPRSHGRGTGPDGGQILRPAAAGRRGWPGRRGQRRRAIGSTTGRGSGCNRPGARLATSSDQRPAAGSDRHRHRRLPDRPGSQGVRRRRRGSARADRRGNRLRQIRVVAHAGDRAGGQAFSRGAGVAARGLQGRSHLCTLLGLTAPDRNGDQPRGRQGLHRSLSGRPGRRVAAKAGAARRGRPGHLDRRLP